MTLTCGQSGPLAWREDNGATALQYTGGYLAGQPLSSCAMSRPSVVPASLSRSSSLDMVHLPPLLFFFFFSLLPQPLEDTILLFYKLILIGI